MFKLNFFGTGKPKAHHNPAPFRDHPATLPGKQSFRGIVTRVVDGDTLDAMLELGMHMVVTERIRVAGINTPEIYGKNASPEGKLAAARARELLEGKPVIFYVHTNKVTLDRKVADVSIYDIDKGVWVDYASAMIAEGHGVPV